MSNAPSSLPDTELPDDSLSRVFGARVRFLREQARITLEQLSGESGVSRAMLSKVERGEKSPTIGVAKRIAQSLSTSLSYLMGGEADRQAVAVVRCAERLVFRDKKTGFERHLLSPPIAGATVEVLQHYIPPGISTGVLPALTSGAEKHVVVERGTLSVIVAGEPVELDEGDTLYFEADVEHAFENRTHVPCRYYLVISRRMSPA